MYKKYVFPLNIFLILENINVTIYSSKSNIANCFFLYTEKKNLFLITKLLKKEYLLNNSTLLDISCVDTLDFNNFLFNTQNFFKKNRIIIYYLYYLYYLKIRIFLITFFNNQNNSEIIHSIDCIFANANWLERESSEMFNINFIFKKDIRKLLLNYTKNEYPMLKDYPTEGFDDVFYNFFNELIDTKNNNNVEL